MYGSSCGTDGSNSPSPAYGLTLIAAPSEEPVTLTRAKLHLRVDTDEDDDLISEWIAAARRMTEEMTRRRWVTQQWRMTLEAWPQASLQNPYAAIALVGEPVSAVGSVKYYATNGTLTTLTAVTDYQTWLDHSPPLVAPAPLLPWPVQQAGKLGAIQVEYTAGYGSSTAVPTMVPAAMLLCLGYWYENRGDGTDSTLMNGLPNDMGIPPAAKRLLNLLSTGGYQ